MKADWIISDIDSSGDIEESGKAERKRLRASLQYSTSSEEQCIASMLGRGWDSERITDLYLTRRPSRVRIENLHRGWMVAGGERESLDQFLARLIRQARKSTMATASAAHLMTELDKPVIGRNSATEDGSDFNEELIYEASLTQG